MDRLEESPMLMKLFAWSGLFLTACWLGSCVFLSEFIPPNSPENSAGEVSAWYLDKEVGIQITCVILMLTGCLWATWGAVVATFVRRMERGVLLTFACVALIGGGYVFFEMIPIFWGVAAFRPGEVDPQVTLTMHDLGWFAFLFDWPPFALFNVVLGVAILADKSVPAVLPRWLGYWSLWCAVLFPPAAGIVFTHHGPLAYDGFLALYVPVGIFFLWMCVFTLAVLRSINRDERMRGAGLELPSVRVSTPGSESAAPAIAP